MSKCDFGSDANCEDIVFNRENNGRIYRDITKRVSFHEDVKDNSCDTIKTYRKTNAVDTSGIDVAVLSQLTAENFVKHCQQEKPFNVPCKEILDKAVNSYKSCSSTPKRHSVENLKNEGYLPLTERGVPEGQEDPRKNSIRESYNLDVPEKKYLEKISSISKRVLVKRFLKSIPDSRRDIKSNESPSSLYIKGYKPDKRYQVPIINQIKEEISYFNAVKRKIEKKNISTKDLFGEEIKNIFSNQTKNIHKVQNALDMNGSPILITLSDESMYIILGNNYSIVNEIHYTNLNGVLISQFEEFLVFIVNKKIEVFNTATEIGSALDCIKCLEIINRRKLNGKLFNIAQVPNRVIFQLFEEYLEKRIPVSILGEDIKFHSWIWLQEDYVDPTSSSSVNESFLMFRAGISSSWKPTLLRLRNGVLYLFDKTTEIIPKHEILLKQPNLKDCKPLYSNRPHSFEIILAGGKSFQFGAADEVDMLHWIDVFLSSSFAEEHRSPNKGELKNVIGCYIAINMSELILYRCNNEIITNAYLQDIITFRRREIQNEYYCMVEFNCREACENDGDWVLHFVSNSSFEEFCSHFIRASCAQMNIEQWPDDESLTKRCSFINSQLRSMWQKNETNNFNYYGDLNQSSST